MFDYHIHTKYCNHAIGEMEEYVQEAVIKNLKEMGFSCHIPYEFYPSEVPRELYAMSLETLKTLYFPEIQRLKHKYEEKINIKTGMEIDYFGWIQDPINEFIDDYSDKLDYIIGSVHILNTKKTVWSIDDNRYSHYYNEFGVDNVYTQYLDAIFELIKTGNYHILAHLDLPKKFGFRPKDKNEFFARISDILEEVRKRGMCVEISTGGLRKHVGELYPEEYIVKMMIERKIPLVTSSDSHKPGEVAYKFDDLYSQLEEWGVTQLYNYSKGNKYAVGIKEI